MAKSSNRVGEKTPSAVAERATGDESRFKRRRRIPAAYLASHRCKVCDGKHCTGHCKF